VNGERQFGRDRGTYLHTSIYQVADERKIPCRDLAVEHDGFLTVASPAGDHLQMEGFIIVRDDPLAFITHHDPDAAGRAGVERRLARRHLFG
jgi:hypothetical protein